MNSPSNDKAQAAPMMSFIVSFHSQQRVRMQAPDLAAAGAAARRFVDVSRGDVLLSVVVEAPPEPAPTLQVA
jgi:hypothetical protein